MAKPDCYKCKYRGEVPGSAHSSCKHPKAKPKDANPMAELLSIMGAPVVSITGIQKLEIEGHPTGVRGGWFNWPYNFDPVWLLKCKGFTPKKKATLNPSVTQTD